MLIGRSSIDFHKLLNLLPFKIDSASKPSPIKDDFMSDEYSSLMVTKYLETIGELERYTSTGNISIMLDIVIRYALGMNEVSKIPSTKRNLNKLKCLQSHLQWLSKNIYPKIIIARFNDSKSNESDMNKPIESLLRDTKHWVQIGNALEDAIYVVNHFIFETSSILKSKTSSRLRGISYGTKVNTQRDQGITRIVCTLAVDCNFDLEQAIGWTCDLLNKYPLKDNFEWNLNSIRSAFRRQARQYL